MLPECRQDVFGIIQVISVLNNRLKQGQLDSALYNWHPNRGVPLVLIACWLRVDWQGVAPFFAKALYWPTWASGRKRGPGMIFHGTAFCKWRVVRNELENWPWSTFQRRLVIS